jgi:hypothetical protein
MKVEQCLFIVIFEQGTRDEGLEAGDDGRIRGGEALLVFDGDFKLLIALGDAPELVVADGDADVEGAFGVIVAGLVAFLEELSGTC